MAEGFVKIRTFWSAAEANLAKLHLNSHGIEAELENEEMVGILWSYSNSTGGVKLCVKIADADQAIDLLKSNVDTGGLGESSGTHGLTEFSDLPNRQQEYLEEHDEDVEGDSPRLFDRMRSVMKIYISISLGFYLFFLFISIISCTSVFMVVPAVVVVGYMLGKQQETEPESKSS